MKTYDPHKDTKDVRQGSNRWMNLRVLTISTLAVVVVFALIYVWFFASGN